ncbi:hypothetical protein EP7_000456 [Isosphaeraceae bacterium EP7]
MYDPKTIQDLATRIETAFLRRSPRWRPGCTGADVWRRAAELLCELNATSPEIPVDPELYVAAQPMTGDPWTTLTLGSSVGRYRRRIGSIVRALRTEIRGEVLRAERQLIRGMAVETVLLPSNDDLSPLGCFIVAHRAGRPELAACFRGPASEQHVGCPLYRQACRNLLPVEAYPAVLPAQELAAADQASRTTASIQVN